METDKQKRINYSIYNVAKCSGGQTQGQALFHMMQLQSNHRTGLVLTGPNTLK